MSTAPDPLYEALVKYEDAANNVGSLTICTQGCYRALTDAIGGHGDILEARTAFEFEAKLLADAHTQWAGCAAVLLAAISDGQEWSQSFVVPYKRCPQCGDAQKPGQPWVHAGGCDSCFADGQERAEHADPPVADAWKGYPAMLSERPWRPE